jgi:hypothetical protein
MLQALLGTEVHLVIEFYVTGAYDLGSENLTMP